MGTRLEMLFFVCALVGDKEEDFSSGTKVRFGMRMEHLRKIDKGESQIDLSISTL